MAGEALGARQLHKAIQDLPTVSHTATLHVWFFIWNKHRGICGGPIRGLFYMELNVLLSTERRSARRRALESRRPNGDEVLRVRLRLVVHDILQAIRLATRSIAAVLPRIGPRMMQTGRPVNAEAALCALDRVIRLTH